DPGGGCSAGIVLLVAPPGPNFVPVFVVLLKRLGPEDGRRGPTGRGLGSDGAGDGDVGAAAGAGGGLAGQLVARLQLPPALTREADHASAPPGGVQVLYASDRAGGSKQKQRGAPNRVGPAPRLQTVSLRPAGERSPPGHGRTRRSIRLGELGQALAAQRLPQ